jgi:hypothetical protein
MDYMLPCTLPQARFFTQLQTATYSEGFNRDIGAYPIDAWATKALYTLARNACTKKDYWTTPICKPQSIELVTAAPPKNQETTGRPTNQMRSSPPPKQPNVERKEQDVENFQQQEINDEEEIEKLFLRETD